MQAPAIGQKVKVIEAHVPAYENGKYVGLRPSLKVGIFHAHYVEPTGRYESWTFKGEDGYCFSTCVGNEWEPHND